MWPKQNSFCVFSLNNMWWVFFVRVCVLFFCFILFVCFCIPLIVLCSKQKQVSKPGIEIDAGMLDVSSICVYSLKTCFKALIARGFFFLIREQLLQISYTFIPIKDIGLIFTLSTCLRFYFCTLKDLISTCKIIFDIQKLVLFKRSLSAILPVYFKSTF